MSTQSTYHLAKFDQGIVYFVKDKLGDPQAGNTVDKIVAIINVKELKEHAQYEVVVVETETAYKKEYTIHGVYLSPNNILNIAVAHIKRDPSVMSHLERIT